MQENRLEVSSQRLGGIFAILSAILFVGGQFFAQAFLTKGVTGTDVYEKTVNSMVLHPVANWITWMIGIIAIVLLFWTVEALEQRIRFIYPNMSSNVSRMAYIYLVLMALYMLLPAAVQHDLYNGSETASQALQLVVHPLTTLGLVLSSLSSVFLGLWLVQVGGLLVKTKALSKPLAIFTLIMGVIILFSACYEALLGREGALGIIQTMLAFLGFVIWRLWLGIEILRKSPLAVTREMKLKSEPVM